MAKLTKDEKKALKQEKKDKKNEVPMPNIYQVKDQCSFCKHSKLLKVTGSHAVRGTNVFCKILDHKVSFSNYCGRYKLNNSKRKAFIKEMHKERNGFGM